MNIFEKTIVGILGIGAAVGAAWLVVEFAKEHPKAAKSIVSGSNEIGNWAADKIPKHPDEEIAIEVITKGKDALAELAKHQLDEYHDQNRRWY